MTGNHKLLLPLLLIFLLAGCGKTNDGLRIEGHDWTYQTVQTFVNRLNMKGFIKIVGKKVRSFEYLPLLTRAEYVAQTRGHLLNGNEGASLSDFVVAMQKLGRCNAADLEKLAETVKLLRG